MANDNKHYQDQEVIEPGDRRYKDDDYFRNQHDRDARDPITMTIWMVDVVFTFNATAVAVAQGA